MEQGEPLAASGVHRVWLTVHHGDGSWTETASLSDGKLLVRMADRGCAAYGGRPHPIRLARRRPPRRPG